MTGYRGRFAPTPSGPLHLGSLCTALAGFLQARTAGGEWLLRIDDLDVQRSRVEHADAIRHQLEAHGLLWDGDIRWQSKHVDEYEAAFVALAERTTLYACTCTRARLAEESLVGIDGPVYAGTCRSAQHVQPRATTRISLGDGIVALDDPWQKPISRNLQSDLGDFVIRRADGAIAYQLASVVDELNLGITEVVRGADLVGSSVRQICLQQILGLTSPRFRHLPVLTDDAGDKLSKQNHATPVDSTQGSSNLVDCLALLGQNPDRELIRSGVGDCLEWAIANWDGTRIPRQNTIAVD